MENRKARTFTLLSAAFPFLYGLLWIALSFERSAAGYILFILLVLAFVPAFGLTVGLAVAAVFRKERRAVPLISLTVVGNVLMVYMYYQFTAAAISDRRIERDRTWGASGSIRNFAIQPDGKIVIVGSGVARLMPDGTLDASFRQDPARPAPLNMRENSVPVQLALQADGKIVVAMHDHCYRLNSNGAEDTSFRCLPPDGEVYALAVQPDGRILIGGDFERVGDTMEWGIARLYENGSLDLSFIVPIRLDPPAHSGDLRVSSLVLESDGRIVIGGLFREVGHTDLYGLARLYSDGSFDRDFAPRRGKDRLTVQRWGTSLLATTTCRPAPRSFTVEVDRGGRIPEYSLARDEWGCLSTITRLKDGGFVISGPGVRRTLANKEVDPSFEYELNHGRQVDRLALQGDKIIVIDHGKLVRLAANGQEDKEFRVPLLRADPR